MSNSYLNSFLFALFPAAGVLAGAILAALFPINKIVKFLVQHFVSGIIFAVVAAELVPLLLDGQANWTITWGFAVAVIFVLGMHAFSHRIKERKQMGTIPYSLTSAVGVDLFLDGLLVGVAFVAGEETGALVAISLTGCSFFVAFALMGQLKKRRVATKVVTWIILISALLVPLGAFVGASVVALLPTNWFYEVVAFGIAALIYLALEEFFLEAHEEVHGGWLCSAFFLGFLIILLISI